MNRLAAVGLAIITILLSTTFVAAEEQPDTRTFTLRHLTSSEAATLLRTIVGVEKISGSDDHTLDATGSQASLHLATELLSALDVPEVVPSQSFTTGNDTVIAVIPLRDILASDAMHMVRELRIQRLVALDKRQVLVVRDTPEQVASVIATLGGSAVQPHQ